MANAFIQESERPIDTAPPERRRTLKSRANGRTSRRAIDRELDAVLADPIFAPREGLSPETEAELAYDRLRFLARAFPITPDDVRTDSERLIAAHERTALVDGTLCTVLSIHYSLCLGTILELGEDRSELMPHVRALESLQSVGVFLATEQAYGNNVAALETRAVYRPEERCFRLSTPSPRARKFMPNTACGRIPKLAVVFARLIVRDEDQGVFPFVVPLHDDAGRIRPGIDIQPMGEKPGYALDNAITSFEEVALPKSSLLSGGIATLTDDGVFRATIDVPHRRFLHFLDRVQSGRVLLTSGLSCLMAAAVQTALNYAAQRNSFSPVGDVPIARFRNVQRDLFGVLAGAHAARAAMRHAKALMSERHSRRAREAFRTIASLKAVTSYAAADGIAVCRERCGAAGLFAENRFVNWWVQAQGVITAEGDNQMMLLKVGRQLALDTSLPDAGDLVRPKPARADWTEDIDFLCRLLRFHEASRIQAVRRAFAAGHAQTGQADDAPRATNEPSGLDRFNDLVCDLINLGAIHGRSITADRFAAALDRPEAPASLPLLFRLWALERIGEHVGWFLAHGALEGSEFETLERTRLALCGVLEPHADELVEALEVPAEGARGPLAARDYIAAYLR